MKSADQWSWSNISNHSPWPFLKAVLFNFIFDGFIFVSYFVGSIAACYILFSQVLNGSIGEGLAGFFSSLIGTYYFPMIVSLIRDILFIAIKPFAKFLSWCSRPAQYLQIDMKKIERRKLIFPIPLKAA